MAVSSPAVPNIHTAPEANASFYEKLNTRWHERALQLFMLVVLAHWGEHLVQAYQIYVMGWPRPMANGILGLWYPWLIKSETLHYGYALVMLIGIWVLRKVLSPLSTVEAMELLLGRLSKTKTNGEFLASMSSPA